MIEVEKFLFEECRDMHIRDVPMIFILGSPRTGSTLLYQVMINFFNLSYISNMVNDNFGENPAVGFLVHHYLFGGATVGYTSSYGKTREIYEPSEGSSVISRWFGGAHPSQIESTKVIPEKEKHIINTFLSAFRNTSRPMLIKNAWNCFRIEELARLFPNIRFIWIRRDIGHSASSDLEARVAKGSKNIWNSATTHNFREIQKKEPFEQVVLQQYEYNRAIGKDLCSFAKDRFIEVWYEDFCSDLHSEIKRVGEFLNLESVPDINLEIIKPQKKTKNEKILKFIDENFIKFKDYTRK